jgi:hypothetical protein
MWRLEFVLSGVVLGIAGGAEGEAVIAGLVAADVIGLNYVL